MSTWILFSIIFNLFWRYPVLTLIVVLAIVYLSRARYTGRYWNPFAFIQAQREIAELRTTVETNPENAAAHNDLGRILALKREFPEALPHLEKAYARSPDSAETSFFYGYVLLASGKEQEGLSLIEKALEAKPKLRYGEPLLLTGDVYFDNKRFEEAIPWFEQFTEMNTDSVEGYYKLGRSLSEVGRREEARRSLEDAADAFQHAPRFIRRIQRPWYRKARWFIRRVG